MSPEQLGQLFVGLGGLGMVGAALGASIFAFVVPWWALFDLLRSDRDSNTKLAVAVVLVFTWGFGSFAYGLFFSRSLALKITIVVSSFVLAGMVILSLGSCVGGAAIGNKVQAEHQEAERVALVEGFEDALHPPVEVAPFEALQFVWGDHGIQGVSVAQFRATGPDLLSAKPLDKQVRHIARTDQGLYAITTHEVGRIEEGSFVEIDTTDLEEFSWPKGIVAVDDQLIVMSSHVYTRLYSTTPDGGWQLFPTAHRDLSLIALTALDNGVLVGLESPDFALRKIAILSPEGALVRRIDLDPPVPLDDAEGTQLLSSGDKAMLVTSQAEVFVIDSETGAVARAQ